MLGRRAKAAILLAALLALAVEGALFVGYYDRYYGSDVGFPGTTAPGGPAAFEGTTPEGTMPEGTASTGDAPSDADDATTFVHRATDANSRGDYTVLGDPRINGDPDAVVLAVPAPEGGSAGDGAYGHNIGVWYVPGKNKWAIFNQDLAPVPAGSAFEVTVPQADEGFLHRAGPADTFSNVTYLDDPLVDGKPGVALSVTQNWNPGGGGRGVYNDHPVGVLYNEDVGKWYVYNEDAARMPEGAAFNVAVSGADEPGG